MSSAIISLGMLWLAPLPAVAEGGQAFSISPPLVELTADPGQTVSAKIKLTNISSDDLLIKMQFNDFGAKNETGEPNIIFDDTQNTAYTLRQWIVSPAPFTIKSKESRTVEFPIHVPEGAEPGGHYAVIRFTGSTPDLEDNGVALTASIGSLVLLQVSGNVTEKASAADFFTATKTNQTNFFEFGPITFVERIQNEGNVHLKPTGAIKIYNTFGQQVGEVRANGDPADTANPPKSVLPGSVRRFEQQWDSGWALGRYRASVELSYGTSSTPIYATTTFWVVPYKLILAILLGGTGLFLLVRFGIRRYNAHIISKAHGARDKSLNIKRK